MDKIRVGTNFISDIPESVVEQVVSRAGIEILKFPGIRCNNDELEKFLSTFERLREAGLQIKAEIHGFPRFVPAILGSDITRNTDWNIVDKLFRITGADNFSTHINAERGARSTGKEQTIEDF